MLHVYQVDERDIAECYRAQLASSGYYADSDWYKRPDDEAYRLCSEMLVEGLTQWLHPITLGELRPGDVMLFSFKSREQRPDHAGIYVGRGEVVHADLVRGVRCDPLVGKLERRLVGIFSDESPYE